MKKKKHKGKPRATYKRKERIVSYRLNDDQYDRFYEIATEEGLFMGTMSRNVIVDFITYKMAEKRKIN